MHAAPSSGRRQQKKAQSKGFSKVQAAAESWRPISSPTRARVTGSVSNPPSERGVVIRRRPVSRSAFRTGCDSRRSRSASSLCARMIGAILRAASSREVSGSHGIWLVRDVDWLLVMAAHPRFAEAMIWRAPFSNGPRMRASAFRKRSLSAGVVHKTGCCPERREIVARRNGLEQLPELLPYGLIGVSTGQGVESPKRQPAGALPVGDLDSSAQGQRSVGFSAAVCQLTIDSPELGLEIALVVAV